MKSVSRLTIAPVKGMALVERDEVELGPNGVADNRRFHVVDESGRRYGQIRNGKLALVRPAWDGRRLSLAFPDGTRAEADVALGEAVTTDFYGRPVPGRVLAGPWNDAVSRYAGRPLRLVMTDAPGAGVDRGRGTVTILSDASLDELAANAQRDGVDPRRFRMLVHVAGCRPHEEDGWLGGRVRVGEAVVRLHEQVARCAITRQDPETGVPDLDTLRVIRGYRGPRAEDGKSIDFGVFGEVEQPGRVRVGDAVEPL